MGIDNPVHLIFLAAVALLVLGPRRLPEVARSLGKGIREFREAMSDGSVGGFMHDHHEGVVPPAAAPAPVPPVEDSVAAAAVSAPDVGSESAAAEAEIQDADVVSPPVPGTTPK